MSDNNEGSFAIGDTVKLKSGGPLMTIDSIDARNKIFCKWFAGSKLENGTFDKKTLVISDKKDK